MPEDGPAKGTVTRSELADLAILFDRFEFAFDPRSRTAKEAESQFEDKVRNLFQERVHPHFPHVSFVAFHCRIKSLCRTYLKKNPPNSDKPDSTVISEIPPTPPPPP